MNDETKSALIKIAIMALTGLAAVLHKSSDTTFVAQIPALATDLVDAGLFAYTIWLNRGMKKVTNDSIVVAGRSAAPTVAAAQKVADLKPSDSVMTVAAVKAAAINAVEVHDPQSGGA